MTIYLSGPITGTDDFKERFEEVERKFKEAFPEAIILNPVNFCADIPAGSLHSVYMDRCIEELKTATHIYFMAGWLDSKGCIMEMEESGKMGLPCLNIDFNI